MASRARLTDVAIIGGGPAGSTAATFLAMAGHSVTVFEKTKMPRDHVGESLLPYCYKIFQQTGILDELERRYVRKPGVRFIDTDGSHFTTWCFGHVIKDPSYLSFHVPRDEFDKLLLDNARKHGARVKESTRVEKVDLEEDDGLIKLYARGPRGGKQIHRAKFIIDASGRDTFLANRMGSKKPHEDLDRIALSTHWKGGKYTEGIDEGLLQIVYLGGKKKGWIWVIPVGVDRLSLGVVLNNSYVRRKKAKLVEESEGDWKLELYRQELSKSSFIKEVLADAHIVQPLMVNGDYSYIVERKFGKNFALIGDASTFIDPIFASGVYLSINSARLVAQALDRALSGSRSDNGNPLAGAYDKINGAYQLVDKAIRMFYNPEAINLAQVGAASTLIHEKHENALAIGHYLLAGDFFDRHDEYSEFLDLLQEPKLFRRFKNYVIDREEFQSTSCGLERTEVFGKLLLEHEMRREKGRASQLLESKEKGLIPS